MFNKIKTRFQAMLKDESGLAAVEYGLLAAGLVVGLYLIISGMGVSLRGIYSSVAADLTSAG
ncbi:MAG TPA: Flp family type IVb pilin [Rhizomicrobium sp.]|nr:Flp family type IVb pilin [Rhizomicrobium sp.]